MSYEIKTVRADDWARLRELRLAALQDPIARVAFIDTHQNNAAQPESFWRGRATPIAEGGAATSIVAVDGSGGTGGSWAGMLVLLDETGEQSAPVGDAGAPRQIHVVSVYVRPEHRGTGLADELFRFAIDWTWANTRAERIRLWVHGDNPRAAAFYSRMGFTPTGETMEFPPVPSESEHEMAVDRP